MTFEPIQRLEIENYGCIKQASFTLNRLHALIGPNDSGKSTALSALRAIAQFAKGTYTRHQEYNYWVPFDPMFETNRRMCGRLVYADNLIYQVHAKSESIYLMEESVIEPDGERHSEQRGSWDVPGLLSKPSVPAVFLAGQRMTRPTFVRFDPDFLRAPAPLIPESQGVTFADDRGSGLASVFDAILNRDSEAFARIQSELRSAFPHVAKLNLINVSDSAKEMAVTLTDGTRIGARAMSEGVLYYLGFAALRHIDGSGLFLVEEPENGLHPVKITEVMNVLKEVSKTGQVILATHSPMVVNELEGHQISVVTRDEQEGTKAVLLNETPNYDKRSEIYLNGELWVAYGDGFEEKAIVEGGPRR